MVPDVDGNVVQAVGHEGWDHVGEQEFLFFLSSIDARIPRLYCFGLVLQRQHHDMVTTLAKFLDIAADICGPALAVTWFQLPAVVAFSIGLHVCRRAPWGKHDVELAAIGLFRVIQHRENILLHPRKGEMPEFVVMFVSVGFIMGQREITAVDGNPHKAVFHILLTKICIH